MEIQILWTPVFTGVTTFYESILSWNLEFGNYLAFGIWDLGFLFTVMPKIEIDIERCKGCGLCTISCPKSLIRVGKEINRQGYFYVNWDDQGTCTGCAICGEICPDIALRVWK